MTKIIPGAPPQGERRPGFPSRTFTTRTSRCSHFPDINSFLCFQYTNVESIPVGNGEKVKNSWKMTDFSHLWLFLHRFLTILRRVFDIDSLLRSYFSIFNTVMSSLFLRDGEKVKILWKMTNFSHLWFYLYRFFFFFLDNSTKCLSRIRCRNVRPVSTVEFVYILV